MRRRQRRRRRRVQPRVHRREELAVLRDEGRGVDVRVCGPADKRPPGGRRRARHVRVRGLQQRGRGARLHQDDQGHAGGDAQHVHGRRLRGRRRRGAHRVLPRRHGLHDAHQGARRRAPHVPRAPRRGVRGGVGGPRPRPAPDVKRAGHDAGSDASDRHARDDGAGDDDGRLHSVVHRHSQHRRRTHHHLHLLFAARDAARAAHHHRAQRGRVCGADAAARERVTPRALPAAAERGGWGAFGVPRGGHRRGDDPDLLLRGVRLIRHPHLPLLLRRAPQQQDLARRRRRRTQGHDGRHGRADPRVLRGKAARGYYRREGHRRPAAAGHRPAAAPCARADGGGAGAHARGGGAEAHAARGALGEHGRGADARALRVGAQPGDAQAPLR
mmetsp:Transcript_35280/g.86739  ORF Transcript_35280/g.86739 Transcript_35280/m.86739 type:complete len:386 (+) Transcript_35280:3542-4699(+)